MGPKGRARKAPAAPASSDANLANSLVHKFLKIRHPQLTDGKWISGYGAFKEDELVQEDPDDAPETNAECKELDSRTQCWVCKKTQAASKKWMEEKLSSRKFRGGCEEGKRMIEEKGDLKMWKDMRIEYWDTTQSDWYKGHIAGMWFEKPDTHWLAIFDDDTEYAIDVQNDAWRLEPGAGAAVPLNQHQSGSYGRFIAINNGQDQALEFIVLTKAHKSRLHVYNSKYSIRVYKAPRGERGPAAEDSEDSDIDTEDVSDAADRENIPDTEQASKGQQTEGGSFEIPKNLLHARLWRASSDLPLKIADTRVEVIKSSDGKNSVALRVVVPVETSEKEKGAKKVNSRVGGL